MTEYITKERAQDLIVAAAQGNSSRLACMLSKLEDEPPADVAPVVRAHWIEDDYAYARCDHCGYEMDYPEYKTPYCPQCGARMEEDGE